MLTAAVLAATAAGLAACSVPTARQVTVAPSVSAAAAPAATAPAPAPVSTAATVTGTCTPGLVDTSQRSAFTSVSVTSGVPWQDGDEIHPGYQVTLTNTGNTTADVGGIAVIFYSQGTETGSDQENATGLIAPGQSLTWTETPYGWGEAEYSAGEGQEDGSAGPENGAAGLEGVSFSAPFTDGDQGAVDSSATCQLASWSSGG